MVTGGGFCRFRVDKECGNGITKRDLIKQAYKGEDNRQMARVMA